MGAGGEATAAKFDLTLGAAEEGDVISLSLNYNRDLWTAGRMRRMCGHLRRLLEAAAEGAGLRVSDIEVQGEEERRLVLHDWNQTAAPFKSDSCLHELFEEQVGRTPEATALFFDEERLTYNELNARANRLARHLRALGVGPDALVGICMRRSPELVVAILAVLKAGGAYVPLDPAYPTERLSLILQDARVLLLLTESQLAGLFPEHAGVALCLDTRREEIAIECAENLARTASADNLAYVIYTSGSTGRPKGVAIEHRSGAALLHWSHETFTQDELSGVLASTSICFDLSIFELFAPLTCGGAAILCENVLGLPQLKAAEHVRLVNTVPSAMAELLRMDAVPPGVRTVNLAGEALSERLVEEVYARPGVTRVWNLYGPTEDTTYSTYALTRSGEKVTVGRPIANTQTYVLDRRQRDVPAGVRGELYLGGAGLARGYFNRPALTAERFVPDPFSAEPGARLYRTGDVVRYLDDGRIEYLGRADHQVKVRGYRIELGEIEAALRREEGVSECVVVAREDASGDKRLVAYVVADGTGSSEARANVSAAVLRRHLKQSLPEYMVPSAFVILGALPLTPNGKVDRRALPAPDFEGLTAIQCVAPRTPVEEALADIWRQVLALDSLGVRDNFFELGGHSLLATQVVSRVRKLFGAELPLRALFESPTVEALAHVVEERLREGELTSAPPLVPAGRDRELPLSFAQ